MLWLFVGPTGVYLLDFFAPVFSFYLLLSPFLCIISLLYLDLYVLGDDALISYPSVKVSSISMENDGVLERAKMGISINGEKEWKNRGLIKRVENGGILSIICHEDGVLEHIGENRWQLCHQVPLIFFAIVFQYWWKTVANFPPFAMTVEYWNISLEIGGIICHHLPSRLNRHFCHRLPELMENDGNYFHRLPPWWRTVAFDG